MRIFCTTTSNKFGDRHIAFATVTGPTCRNNVAPCESATLGRGYHMLLNKIIIFFLAIRTTVAKPFEYLVPLFKSKIGNKSLLSSTAGSFVMIPHFWILFAPSALVLKTLFSVCPIPCPGILAHIGRSLFVSLTILASHFLCILGPIRTRCLYMLFVCFWIILRVDDAIAGFTKPLHNTGSHSSASGTKRKVGIIDILYIHDCIITQKGRLVK